MLFMYLCEEAIVSRLCIFTLIYYMGLCEDYLTCDIAFDALMPLSRASTRRRYSRIEGITDPTKGHHLLKCVSDVECLHKDLHATTGMSPESLPHGGSGLKGDSLRRCGASCHGNGLAGFAKTAPGKDLAGGVRFIPFALCGLGIGVVLLLLSFGLTLAHLPRLAQCGGARGSDCPCTVIGVQKVYPSFCTPTAPELSVRPHCNASPWESR